METRKVDRMFKAFADETRLRILHLLSLKDELCVCDIIAVLRQGQSKVSRHLAYLKNAGLVKDRKEGLWSYYTLAKPASPFHKQILVCLDNCFEEVPTLKLDRQSLSKARLSEACCK